MNKLAFAFIAMFTLLGCTSGKTDGDRMILFKSKANPFITLINSTYYLTMQNESVDSILLYSANSVEKLPESTPSLVWTSTGKEMSNIYSPEIHRIDGKWYIYFEADNSLNTDTHQIYVLENSSPDPMTGEWIPRGPLVTDPEWNFGLHPSTFVVGGRRYLLWSGWQKQRAETETQCIYIAEMENPWTLKSQRVMISSPKYEWERQWINPDGSRTAYPIYVNENPLAMISPDGKTVVVGYSANGIWTVYNVLGLLHADADSNLLDPDSWRKEPEPFFVADEASGLFGCSNISVTPSATKGEYDLVYQAKHFDERNQPVNDVRWKRIKWGDNGLPDFGTP